MPLSKWRASASHETRNSAHLQQHQHQFHLNQNNHNHYYYAPGLTVSRAPPNGNSSLASSQHTDESPSNTDESNRAYGQAHPYAHYAPSAGPQPAPDNDSSDYHYYQAVLPPAGHAPDAGLMHDSGLSITSLAAGLARAPDASPPTHLEPNLVSCEPLIRSSSWQNKTLIDLRRQLGPPCVQQLAGHPSSYLESSLIQKTLPMARPLPALGAHHQPGAADAQHLRHSLHLFGDKMAARRLMYAHQPAPGGHYVGGRCARAPSDECALAKWGAGLSWRLCALIAIVMLLLALLTCAGLALVWSAAAPAPHHQRATSGGAKWPAGASETDAGKGKWAPSA